MLQKKHLLFLGIIVVLLLLDIISSQITNGVIQNAYRPYQGVVAVVDAGHGGKDDGARNGAIREQELNLIFANKVKERLEKLGMKVILTRSDDNDLARLDATNRKREDMKQRVLIINQKKVDFFISIHMNSYADSSIKGGQLFYATNDSDSQYLASCIQQKLKEICRPMLEIKSADYYILKESNKIGILWECGFLSNPTELEKLVEESYQDKLCDALVKGILDFFKNVYE